MVNNENEKSLGFGSRIGACREARGAGRADEETCRSCLSPALRKRKEQNETYS